MKTSKIETLKNGSTTLSQDSANRNFPPGFLWGAATSHFQIEGYTSEMQSRLSDWSSWMMSPSNIIDGSNAEQACDFLNRYLDDISLMESLNLNAFRISINWPAILIDAPGTAGVAQQLDPEGVEYYRRVLSTLKERGIKTFVTLFHFCLPTWLADQGGWNNPLSAEQFGTFTTLVVDAFGEYVDYWLTINEPMAYVYQGYVSGQWTPGLKNDYLAAFGVVRNMLVGHAAAYQAIKAKYPNAPVSFTNHWRPFIPEQPLSPLDHAVCMVRDNIFNQLFPQSIQTGVFKVPPPLGLYKVLRLLEGPIPGLKGSMDYLGINYYTRELSRFKAAWPIDPFGEASDKTQFKTNALGWETYPEGLYQVLTRDIRPYRYNTDGSLREIFITENGYAEKFERHLDEGDWSLEDSERVDYLVRHVKVIHDAIAAGVPVRGYLHWSLLDNFEWAEGLQQRFGLVRVTYPNQTRAPRKSAYVYADIAASNALNKDLLLKHPS
ncbi:MAG: family 1 glycosylhydrolase [Candidatus Melainabacteria bacterium]|nr:family 1 glycosylhydrolase [Candidatus Melainabacteria bacterium]